MGMAGSLKPALETQCFNNLNPSLKTHGGWLCSTVHSFDFVTTNTMKTLLWSTIPLNIMIFVLLYSRTDQMLADKSEKHGGEEASMVFFNRQGNFDAEHLPEIPDLTLIGPESVSLQKCRQEGFQARQRSARTSREILLLPESMHLGTSANAQELDVLETIALVHRENSICGPLIEIGVYKGWFVAALASLVADSSAEKVYAFDLFGDQDANVDNSGGATFHKPLIKYFFFIVAKVNALDHVVTVKANSLELESTQILNLMKYNPRIVSVDGAHFGMAAFHDLVLASAVMHPKGIVALDDFSNDGWPGVSSAYATFVAVWSERLQPFLLTKSKLYLSRPAFHEMYLEEMASLFPNSTVCPGQFLVMKPDTRVTLETSKIRSFVYAGEGEEDYCRRTSKR